MVAPPVVGTLILYRTKFLRRFRRGVSMTPQFIARVVELVDTQVSEACA